MKNIIHIVLLLVSLACPCLSHYAGNESSLHDVFHFIHGPYYDSTDASLDSHTIEHMFEEMFVKAECEEKAPTSNCSLCLEDLMTTFVPADVGNLEQWEKASLAVLYAVLDPGAFCNMSAIEMASLNTTNVLLTTLGTDATNGIGEEEIEMLMEKLMDGFSGAAHHHEEEEHGEHEEHEEEEEHGVTRCFGEGTLLYYLGIDHEDIVEMDRVPEMAGIVVSFLVQDWIVQEVCEVLPKQTDIIGALFESLGGTHSTLTEAGFEKLLESLGIGSVAGPTTTTSAPVDDGHDHEGHAHKRSLRYRYKRSEDHDEHDHSLTEECMSETTLATIYNLDLHDGINGDQFTQLCPALIQQQIEGACEPANISVNTTQAPERVVTSAELYGYGTIAVIIISSTSVMGALLIPCLHARVMQYFLGFFVALGASTMLSDSLLHLLPMALGLHSHEGHDHDHDEPITVSEETKIQIVVCVAIYAFWLFETLMGLLRPKGMRSSHAHDIVQVAPAAANDEKDLKQGGSDSDMSSSGERGRLKFPPVALMIIVGDGVHNLIDGIAIGAAFATSLQEGLGTSIAIFCHELPHEMGDFSILIQVGLSKVQAVLFNLLSACTCLIGLFIGGAVASASDDARRWLLALTAGMFIYIALVDMLPQLMNPSKEGKWWIHLIAENLGMIFGIVIMLLIAVYEERIIHLE